MPLAGEWGTSSHGRPKTLLPPSPSSTSSSQTSIISIWDSFKSSSCRPQTTEKQLVILPPPTAAAPATQTTTHQQLALAPGVWGVAVAEEDDDDDNDEDKGGRHPGKMTHTFTVCRRVRGGVVTVPTIAGRGDDGTLSRKQLREALRMGTVTPEELLMQNQRHQAQQQQRRRREAAEEEEERQEPEMVEPQEQLEELQLEQGEEQFCSLAMPSHPPTPQSLCLVAIFLDANVYATYGSSRLCFDAL
ncbi:hypothetical protein CI102_12588 [Trichoderma harzianum]|nr:hypothetical protein CI102_12588 [Trichoderma harzianum]